VNVEVLQGSPASILFTGIALPPLEDLLQRIIDDPPVLVEWRYEAI
jgi:hypothetical protein